MIPLRRPSGCRFADRLIMNERTPDGPPLVSFSGHCCKFSVGIRMIPKRAASAKPVTPPAGKLPQAVRTPRSLGELRGAFIEKQAACLSPVRCMPPLPSGERSDGVAGRTGLCTGAECDACEVISVALTASVKKGRPLSADRPLRMYSRSMRAVLPLSCIGRRLPMPIPYPSPQKNYSRTGRTVNP